MATPRDGGAPPRRTCIGCRRTALQDELTRVVRRDDGSLAVGRALPGRGAWLCRASPECLQQAIRRRAFDRAFRAPVRPEALRTLAEHFEAARADVPDCSVAGSASGGSLPTKG